MFDPSGLERIARFGGGKKSFHKKRVCILKKEGLHRFSRIKPRGASGLETTIRNTGRSIGILGESVLRLPPWLVRFRHLTCLSGRKRCLQWRQLWTITTRPERQRCFEFVGKTTFIAMAPVCERSTRRHEDDSPSGCDDKLWWVHFVQRDSPRALESLLFTWIETFFTD